MSPLAGAALSLKQGNRETVCRAVSASVAFKAESASLARGGFEVGDRPRLFKLLDDDLVRLIYPVRAPEIAEGAVIALVCLYDLKQTVTVYAHAIHAGPSVNASLRSLFVPETQARPQPGVAGYKAIQKFVAWKQAAWTQFLNDELDLGTERASALWLERFWKALDRMYGGGNLV